MVVESSDLVREGIESKAVEQLLYKEIEARAGSR